MRKGQRSLTRIAQKANLDPAVIEEMVEIAIEEDLQEGGDITSAAILDPSFEVVAQIHGEETGVIAGAQVASKVFSFLDPSIAVSWEVEDGDEVSANKLIVTVKGRARPILAAERTALNFLQHMSGIATFTAQFVEKVKAYPVKILDTRKTTPGIRVLEKYAVTVGGGYNHRLGLYDAVLIKENHVRAVGGTRQAISLIRQSLGDAVQIEIETENLDEVREALEEKADIIMLDNMDIKSIQEAVKLVDRKAVLEVSGGVRLSNVEEIAQTGVDLISTSELTQSALSLDMSLEII